MFWLSDGEENIMLALFVLIQYRSVTDRQTDGQTVIPSLAIIVAAYARGPAAGYTLSTRTCIANLLGACDFRDSTNVPVSRDL